MIAMYNKRMGVRKKDMQERINVDKIMRMCSRSDLQYIYMYERHV